MSVEDYIDRRLGELFDQHIAAHTCPRCDVLAVITEDDGPWWCPICGMDPADDGPAPAPAQPRGLFGS